MQNGGQQNNPSLRVNAKKISEHLTAKLPVQKSAQAKQDMKREEDGTQYTWGTHTYGMTGNRFDRRGTDTLQRRLDRHPYFSEEHVDQNV